MKNRVNRAIQLVGEGSEIVIVGDIKFDDVDAIADDEPSSNGAGSEAEVEATEAD